MGNPYLRGKFGEFPPYDRFAAEDAIVLYKSNPTQENLNRAVLENIRIAAWFTYQIIDRKRLAYLTDDEIYSICCHAVEKAVKRFSFDHNVRFSTFATRVMLNAVVSENIREQRQQTRFGCSDRSNGDFDNRTDHRESEFDTVEIEEAFRLVEDWVSTNLTDREKIVYRDRQNGLTLRDIAPKIGATKGGVAFIHNEIKRKLQEQFAFLRPATEG